jgi:hypothetical protein
MVTVAYLSPSVENLHKDIKLASLVTQPSSYCFIDLEIMAWLQVLSRKLELTGENQALSLL